MKCPNCGEKINSYTKTCIVCSRQATQKNRIIERGVETRKNKIPSLRKFAEELDEKAATRRIEKVQRSTTPMEMAINPPPESLALSDKTTGHFSTGRSTTLNSSIESNNFTSYIICPTFQTFRLEKDKNFGIGRDGQNQLALPFPEISRLHATIRWEKKAYSIKDLGSSNGTYVNNRVIDSHCLRNGDIINIGNHTLFFREVLAGSFADNVYPDIVDTGYQVLTDLERVQNAKEIFFQGLERNSEVDLKDVDIATAIQIATLEKLSGYLKITWKKDSANIYFLRGVVVHCVAERLMGRDAFFQVLLWQEGIMDFIPSEVILEITMSDDVDWLLMQAMKTLPRK